MKTTKKTNLQNKLRQKIEDLESRLRQAEETLAAIRSGEVDALIVATDQGDRVFTLTGAEQLYRTMVEMMNEGAVTVSSDGVVLYANKRFAEMVKTPLESIIGGSLYRFIDDDESRIITKLIEGRTKLKSGRESFFQATDGTLIPVLLSITEITTGAEKIVCLVAADITELRMAQQTLQESNDLLELRVSLRTRRLREAEERYRLVIKATNDAIYDIDLSAGDIAWNETLAAHFGAPPEAGLLWQWWVDHIHPDDRDATVAGLFNAIEGNGESWTAEHRFRKNDGAWAFMLDRAFIGRDRAGKAVRFVGSLTDLTPQKLVEQQLTETTQRLQALMRALPVGATFSTDATCKRIIGNPAALEQFEVKPEDNISASAVEENALGRRVQYFHKGRRLNDSELPLQRAVAENNVIPAMELEIRLPSGRKWIAAASGAPIRDAGGKAIAGVAVTLDLTERKRMEDALRESERRYHTLFKSMSEGFALHEIVLDAKGQPCDYIFLDVNPAFEKLTGYKRIDIIGRTQKEVLPDEGPIWLETYGAVALTGNPDSFEEYSPTMGKYFEVFAYRVGRRQFAAVFRDVSDRKRAEEEVTLRTAQLEAANRELEGFCYSVSHDLRAPLRAIDGFSRMLQKQYGDRFQDDAGRRLNVIRDNVQMMGQLIEDLLAFSRLSQRALSHSHIDMRAMTEEIWKELLAANPKRRMMLKLNDLLPVEADPSLIRQVLINLLSNAVKFTKKRDIAVIEVSSRKNKNEIIYEVKDNGTGFDMKYYDKLFGVFQRLHSSDEYEGTGVGLAIVQRIILHHGGRVWGEGRINEGATFCFSLPQKPRRRQL